MFTDTHPTFTATEARAAQTLAAAESTLADCLEQVRNLLGPSYGTLLSVLENAMREVDAARLDLLYARFTRLMPHMADLSALALYPWLAAMAASDVPHPSGSAPAPPRRPTDVPFGRKGQP